MQTANVAYARKADDTRDFVAGLSLRNRSCKCVIPCCRVLQQSAQQKSESVLFLCNLFRKRRTLIGWFLFTFGCFCHGRLRCVLLLLVTASWLLNLIYLICSLFNCRVDWCGRWKIHERIDNRYLAQFALFNARFVAAPFRVLAEQKVAKQKSGVSYA